MLTYEEAARLWDGFPGELLPWYQAGVLFRVDNEPSALYEERDRIYDARFIMSDGAAYDLHDPESVRSLPIPQDGRPQLEERFIDMGVTGCLEYVLTRKATKLNGAGMTDAAIEVQRKATELMMQLPSAYPKKDMLRAVRWLKEAGRVEEAAALREEIEAHFAVPYPGKGPHFTNENAASMLVRALDDAKRFDTDLLRSCDSGACCASCAMYRRRIFSISGDDARYPILPSYHCDCGGINFLPVVLPPSAAQLEEAGRPYIDDRSEEERRNYQDVLDRRVYRRRSDEDEDIYYKLRRLFPEDVPKTFAAFLRSRNTDTEKYRQLVEKAEAQGLFILLSEADRAAIERHLAYCKERGIKP